MRSIISVLVALICWLSHPACGAIVEFGASSLSAKTAAQVESKIAIQFGKV
jgi:hypothetical protein